MNCNCPIYDGDKHHKMGCHVLWGEVEIDECKHKWEVPTCEHCGEVTENKMARCSLCHETVIYYHNDGISRLQALVDGAKEIIEGARFYTYYCKEDQSADAIRLNQKAEKWLEKAKKGD